MIDQPDIGSRKIIHIDMDAFFASVEQRDFPEYRGKPLVVGGSPESRGVVAAASYEARQYGLKSAMPSSRAVKLCPEVIFARPRFEAYRECSQQIHQIFRQFTDIIEPLSLDEAFLDVTDTELFQGSATLLAQEIKQQIKQQLDLTASAGVSYCKFLAKIASDLNKPDGLAVIRPEQAERFLESLPIRKFFGIGKATESKMNRFGIFTGGDLKKLSREVLQQRFGSSGDFYYNIVRGIDNRPVRTSRVRKSIGKETTFATDLTDQQQLWPVLEELAGKVAKLLADRQFQALTVTLKVKYANFQQITRSHTVDAHNPIRSNEDILQQLPPLIEKTELGQRAVRLLGVTVSSLQVLDAVVPDETEQLLLFSL